MHNYPEKTCDIDRLIRHPRLVTAALSGEKREQRRDGVYGYPGEEFELEGVRFVITALTRQSLGDISDEDARAEGYPDLASYKALILRMHAGMEWNEEHLVWVHRFERV